MTLCYKEHIGQVKRSSHPPFLSIPFHLIPYPSSPFSVLNAFLWIPRGGEDEINLARRNFCSKTCCEMEFIFVDELCHLAQIERRLRERMQRATPPPPPPATLSICSFLIDPGQNAGRSFFFRSNKISDEDNYLIQEPSREVQVTLAKGMAVIISIRGYSREGMAVAVQIRGSSIMLHGALESPPRS